MNEYELVNNIKDNKVLFKSFNQLAQETFEINFEDWAALGYWEDSYIPYALMNQKEIIANASITKGELVVRDKRYQVIQIGTVMTKKAYRSQGLSKILMERIIEKYQETSDIIYLFANETVLDFYPKFGFKRVNELSVVVPTNQLIPQNRKLKQCQFEIEKEKLENYGRNRNNHHLETYLVDNYSLTMFYFSTVFAQNIYFIEDLDVFVTYEIEGEELHLFDILSQKAISVKEVLSYLPIEKITSIVCHFHLKEEIGLIMTQQEEPLDEDALFFLGKGSVECDSIKFPLFSHS
ncbi:MAG: GNAT family N-acetyltransferase [Vagococcus sp.]|uniref:GNAT family N-acetyltransferase n=1 Tax=Vagococcus sp. TaxID=1933889 RepID=UPI002FC9EF94